MTDVLEAARTIDRPIDEVFARMTDIEGILDWSGGTVVEFRDVPEGKPSPGDTFIRVFDLGGQRVEAPTEVVAYEAPTRYAHRSEQPFTVTNTFELEEVNGSTQVTIRSEAELTGTFAQMRDEMLPRVQEQTEQTLDNLKNLLESGR
ncbi:MAG: SRPBCC family protein [Anaerolineales bacterium]